MIKKIMLGLWIAFWVIMVTVANIPAIYGWAVTIELALFAVVPSVISYLIGKDMSE